MTRLLPLLVIRRCITTKITKHVGRTNVNLQPTASQLHRLQLFESEQVRQRTYTRDRLSKLLVKYNGLPEDVTVMANSGLSTPLDIAAHVQELLCRRSVVALVDGQLWDMNRPIDGPENPDHECQLELLHFKSPDPHQSNLAFWRSCSFILGAVLESAFRDAFQVQLCSFPPPHLQSGSFVYDIRIICEDDSSVFEWEPSSEQLRALSKYAQRLAFDNLPFEPLDIDVTLASEMFSDSPMKAAQIPVMAKQWSGPGNPRIRVYKVGNHVDVCRGPLMSHTGLIGRFSVTAVHIIESPSYGPLCRVQGVALPPDFLSHFTTFDLLQKRARKLNSAMIPMLKNDDAPKVES